MFAKCLKAFNLSGPLGPSHISVKVGDRLAISELSRKSLEFEVVGDIGNNDLIGCITPEYKDHIQLNPVHLTPGYLAENVIPETVASAWGIPFEPTRPEDLPRHERYYILFPPVHPDKIHDFDDPDLPNPPTDPHWTIEDRATGQEVSIPTDILLDAFKQAMLWAANGNLVAGGHEE